MTRELPEPVGRDKIVELAHEMVRGTVWDLWSVIDQDVDIARIVFMPISFGALRGFTEEQCGQIMIFGVLGKHATANRSINNFPIFISCCLWRLDDYQAAVKLAIKMQEAQQDVIDQEDIARPRCHDPQCNDSTWDHPCPVPPEGWELWRP